MFSFPFVNTPTWADILFEKLKAETGGMNLRNILCIALARYLGNLSPLYPQLPYQNYLPISASFDLKRVV